MVSALRYRRGKYVFVVLLFISPVILVLVQFKYVSQSSVASYDDYRLEVISERYKTLQDLDDAVAEELVELGTPNNYWYNISEGYKTPNDSNTKIIYGATRTYITTWKDMLTFRGCTYNNCVIKSSLTLKFLEQADVVLFYFREIKRYPKLTWKGRANQLWILYTDESPGYVYNKFPHSLNNIFNASMSYHPEADIIYPYGVTVSSNYSHQPSWLNQSYAAQKTKGAFVYVSNCNSENYDRMRYLQKLAEYIDIDIFGGCNGKYLCARGDWRCEDDKHSQYRFYLSFENSLCQSYITEKFWSRLQSKSYVLPVALGGLMVEEYTKVAPPDSFLHVYNFTSIEGLGLYLQYLSRNEQAYNRYHEWRKFYSIETFGHISMCKLCEFANLKPSMPAKSNIADWWNNPSMCQRLTV